MLLPSRQAIFFTGYAGQAALTEKLHGPPEPQRSSKGQHTYWILMRRTPEPLADRPAGVRYTTSALCLLRPGPQARKFMFPSTPDMADKEASASGLGTSLT